MSLGIAYNPHARNVPSRLIESAGQHGVPIRVIDLPTLTVDIQSNGQVIVADRAGAIEIDSLAPYLLFGYPAAVYAFRILLRQAYSQNPVDSVLTADDKAATAERLSAASVGQVASKICSLDLEQVLRTAAEIGYPVVLKRTHGAQGRWVRRAGDAVGLRQEFHELAAEGRGALILQPEIAEFRGRTIRALVTGGELLAVTERRATGDEWRSNVAGGALQRPVELAPDEKRLVEEAARALELRHAGIDLLRTTCGTLILEVNSCPDFTSMLPYFDDLSLAVLLASRPGPAPEIAVRPSRDIEGSTAGRWAGRQSVRLQRDGHH